MKMHVTFICTMTQSEGSSLSLTGLIGICQCVLSCMIIELAIWLITFVCYTYSITKSIVCLIHAYPEYVPIAFLALQNTISFLFPLNIPFSFLIYGHGASWYRWFTLKELLTVLPIDVRKSWKTSVCVLINDFTWLFKGRSQCIAKMTRNGYA